ncbi:MAG TPA: hypothetical protein VFH51_04555 [Myxococcota bacterium]|nr:hypothetical protein [Myxococcota bacterium]
MNSRALLVGLVLGALPSTARAHIGYGVGFGWGPAYVVPSEPSLFYVNHQYYDLSVSGLEDMCHAQPALCDTQGLKDSLLNLERERAVGYSLALAGFGVAVGGPLISALQSCRGNEGTCQPNWTVVSTSLITGTVLGVLGLIITPSTKDLVGYINATNAAHPENPIRLNVGVVGQRTPALLFATGF